MKIVFRCLKFSILPLFIFLNSLPALPGESETTVANGALDLPPLEKEPVLLFGDQNLYPRQTPETRVKGDVELDLVVSDSGTVDSVAIVRSLHPLFDSIAVESVKKFRFSPARAEGKPVPVILRYAYRFIPPPSTSTIDYEPAPAAFKLDAGYDNIINVFGFGSSITSRSIAQAEMKKKEIPGGFAIKNLSGPEKGRTANFQDMLSVSPGVYMQSEGGAEASKVSIRGSGIQAEDEPVGIQFLLDGFAFNQGDGEVNLEDFDLNSVDFAEIYRGANAFKYGSATLGGAINLTPHTGYTSGPLRIRLDYGNFGDVKGSVAGGKAAGKIDYYGAATLQYRSHHRAHSRENLERAFCDVGYRLQNGAENRLYLTLCRLDRRIPGPLTQEELSADPLQADPDAVAQDFGKKYAVLRIADKLSIRWNKSELTAGAMYTYRSLESRSFYSAESREGIAASGSINAAGIVDYVHHGEMLGLRNDLTVGALPTLENERTTHYKNMDGNRGDSTASIENVSFTAPCYAEVRQYFTENASAVLGMQAIYTKRRFNDRFNDDDGGDNSAGQDFYGFNPKTGLIYEFGPSGQAFVNFSRSWQPPSFDNLLEFGEDTTGRIEYVPLKAQTAWSVECGVRLNWRDLFEGEASIYRSRVRDELLNVNDIQGNKIGVVNVPNTIHQGIEAGLEIGLVKGLFTQGKKNDSLDRISLDQSFTLNDFYFNGDATYGRNRIAGIPRHFYQAELTYENPKRGFLSFSVGGNLSRYPVDQANTLFARPYALLGINAGFRANRKTKIFIELKNLTDIRYAAGVEPIADAAAEKEALRVFQPGDGRSVYGGIELSF